MTIRLPRQTRSWLSVAVAISFAIAGSLYEASAKTPGHKFKNETYRSLDGKYMVTFVSPVELEYQKPGEGRQTYKYERSRDVIRLIQGRNENLHFKIIPEGLENAEGAVLLSPAAYERARASG